MKIRKSMGSALLCAIVIGGLSLAAGSVIAGPAQEYGRSSVYAKGPVRSTAAGVTATVERFGRSSLYAGDVRITPWKDPGQLPSTIAGNGRGSVYAMPLSGQREQPTRVAQRR
jgi:hypothetical protein